jgi:hypothetical protein
MMRAKAVLFWTCVAQSRRFQGQIMFVQRNLGELKMPPYGCEQM